MPSLTGKSEAAGPIIQIGVLKPGDLAALRAKGGGAIRLFAALIDTGASHTCVSPLIAREIEGLELLGKHPMTSATETIEVNTYLADLLLPFVGGSGYGLHGHRVLEFAARDTDNVQMLLGRDILCQGIFTLSPDGHFSFAI